MNNISADASNEEIMQITVKRTPLLPFLLFIPAFLLLFFLRILPMLSHDYALLLWADSAIVIILIQLGHYLTFVLFIAAAASSLADIKKCTICWITLILSLSACLWIAYIDYLMEQEIEHNKSESSGINGDFPLWVAPAD